MPERHCSHCDKILAPHIRGKLHPWCRGNAAAQEIERERTRPFQPAKPGANTPHEDGYVYHATSLEYARFIAREGLKTHKPWDYTEQDAWPDGGREKRSYFSRKANMVWYFAPEEGRPVVLRVPYLFKYGFHVESTGDVYTTQRIPAPAIQILATDGRWLPLVGVDL